MTTNSEANNVSNIEQQQQKLYDAYKNSDSQDPYQVKFEDLSVLFSERKQEILPHILSKYGLNEDKAICPECHAVARKIQKGVLICNCEDQEIVLNKRGKYLPEKHMAKNFDFIVGRVTDKKYGVVLKEMREHFHQQNKEVQVDTVRKWLKVNSLTKFYPYCTAFCLDLLASFDNPINTISSETYERCWTTLRHFISCTREDEGNRMNFTYVVYKLIDLYGNEEEKEILKYIHLQSATAQRKHEKSWKKNM